MVEKPRLKAAVAMGALILLLQGIAYAQPDPVSTLLDPTTIPKYVTPLVIPPVMPKSTTQPGFPAADYNIAVRQFKQQVLPAPFPPTTVWSYGRAQDVLPVDFVAPVPRSSNISFNYPAFTVENISGSLTKVRWINDLVDPETKNFLPHLFAVDQTLHWANPPAAGCTMGAPNRTDCNTDNPAPYTGPVPIVTHVHGSHVNMESDGYPEAWWLPAANNIPSTYARQGSKFNQFNSLNRVPGSAYYGYENNQPAATLWYHDHALGMTRNNVYAGPAGFWLIRGGANGDAKVRDNLGNLAKLPDAAPRGNEDPNFDSQVRKKVREIPLAIQDRSFKADGSLFYPDSRTLFDGFPGPFIPDNGSDISPIWNPEAFFNTIVVNGSTWPQLEVAPARYRFRLLDGCNSRTLNLSLFIVQPDGTVNMDPIYEIPFFQLGAEQGFLPKVAMIKTGYATPLPGDGNIPETLVPAPDPQQALLLGPAERADVIVDFTGLPEGTVVRMINTAPDAPFGGFPDTPADPATTGQVMQFVVKHALTTFSDSLTTPPKNLKLPAEAPLGVATNTRPLSLNELSSQVVCVSVDGDGNFIFNGEIVVVPPNAPCPEGTAPFGPRQALLGILSTENGITVAVPKMWSESITETPLLDSTEVWEIYNTTVDAHPIHLHLVRFEVVNRQDFDADFNPVVGTVTLPNAGETGYKDTVLAYPGQITRIKAKFDVPGEYVWHCHIVEHEDNEMMRPYLVRFDPDFPDLNRDGKLSFADLVPLLAEFLKPVRNPAFDLNGDGKVDQLDTRFLMAAILNC
ncbi:multicopper oxidase domain-containing protein [Geotalea toluenoxydans]